MDMVEQDINDKGANNPQVILRQAIDTAIQSLGGPIHKTIMWHMNNRGVFSDPKKVDVNNFYSNLKELVGPGAEMIMEETFEQLQKRYAGNINEDFRRHSPVEKIHRIMEIGEA
jgi:hypothetical protein